MLIDFARYEGALLIELDCDVQRLLSFLLFVVELDVYTSTHFIIECRNIILFGLCKRALHAFCVFVVFSYLINMHQKKLHLINMYIF